jgi:hypothetical protein
MSGAARCVALTAMAAATAIAGAMTVTAAALQAQTPRSAVLADSIHVGNVVPVAIRVTVGPGDRVILPPMLDLGSDDLENAGRVREMVDTLADGELQVTGVYAITPWRPGTAELPDVVLQVHGADGQVRTLSAALPPMEVLSVLPLDAEALEPMPARGVLGPSYVWWPFVLLVLGLLLLAAAVWWWLRRRRPATALAAAPTISPREAALAALHDARAAGLVERGEWKEFYTRVSVALRVYLEAIEPGWSEDLTTTELLARVRATAGHDAASDLGALLRPADQVKFARRSPDAATAGREWDAARQWVERFQWPRVLAPVEEAA